MSAGLVSYYYQDLDDLVLEVHHDAVDRFYWARLGVVESVNDPREKIAMLATRGIADATWDELSVVLYELHLQGSRNKFHATLMTTLFDREVSLYCGVLELGRAQGVFALRAPLRTVATNAVALEDAYGLHIAGRNVRVTPATARSLLLSYLASMTACDLESAASSATVGAPERVAMAATHR